MMHGSSSLSLMAGSLLAALLLGSILPAHGGVYRGAPLPATLSPPPASGAGSPTVPPKPRLPLLVQGPHTGGVPTGGGTPRPGTPGFTGIRLEPDPTGWQPWWEFNKDRFLLLRAAVRGAHPATGGDEWFMGAQRRPLPGLPDLAPSLEQKRDRILPALRRVLLSTNNPDLLTACLIAMAKIGVDHKDFGILGIFRDYLRGRSQEVRETAALALGISRRPEALSTLAALLQDDKRGRLLLDRSEVDDRTRAFAAYGLGILASGAGLDTKTQACGILRKVLEELVGKGAAGREVKVAVVQALGVLGLQKAEGGKQKRLVWQVLPLLWDYYRKDLGPGEEVVQAHVPVAIGRLLGRGNSLDHRRVVSELGEVLRGRSKRSPALRQSAALGLGLLAVPEDKETSKLLEQYYHGGKDQQARYFCLIALGQIGGDENRTRLLKVLARGKKSLERPWAALALGVMCHRSGREGREGREDRTVGEAILQELETGRNRQALGAFALALGLCGYEEAGAAMRAMLQEHYKHDELAGYLCVGLSLLGDQRAVPKIRPLLYSAVRRPELLAQAATALGRLEDREAIRVLLQLIAVDDPSTARTAAIASALGLIGDRRTVEPLLRLVSDEEVGKLSRAFVAAALGSIAAEAMLPYNERYARNCNYRAAVDSLTNGLTGILDLL